jgi:hypothetical protein
MVVLQGCGGCNLVEEKCGVVPIDALKPQRMSRNGNETQRDACLVSLSRDLYIGSMRPLCSNGVIVRQSLWKGAH